MTWVKIDDGFFRHPKIRAAGRDARDLQLAALQYCNENLTDGFVPEYEVPRLAMEAFIEYPNIPAAVESLLNKRQFDNAMWQRVSGGFQIHDFHVYQPSAAEVRKDRESNAQRQREFQERRRREQKEKTPLVTNTVSNKENNSVSNAEKEPFFDENNTLVTGPPVSRIPSPESRNPEPDPPKPPSGKRPALLDPDPGGVGVSGNLSGQETQVLEQVRRFAPSEAEAAALLSRLGAEGLRWEIAALEWRIANRRADDDEIRRPWLYLLDTLRRGLPLPAAIKAQRDAARAEEGEAAKAADMRQRAEAVATQLAQQQAGRDAAKARQQICEEAWLRIDQDEQGDIQTEVEAAMCHDSVVFRGHRDKYGAGWTQRRDCITAWRDRRDELLTQRGLVHEDLIQQDLSQAASNRLQLVTLEQQEREAVAA